jgi:hypothetical protein
LIAETEQAIIDADRRAVLEHDRALDPTTTVDLRAAHERMQEAAFVRDRLKAALPQLRDHLSQCQVHAAYTSWMIRRDAVKATRDAAAERFKRVPALIAELTDIFTTTHASNAEVGNSNGTSPSGAEHLFRAELMARNLPAFSASQKSLLETCILFDADGRQVWRRGRRSIQVCLRRCRLIRDIALIGPLSVKHEPNSDAGSTRR